MANNFAVYFNMLILPENKTVILNNEDHFSEFADKLVRYPDINASYIVTDYGSIFAAMIAGAGRQEIH